MKLVNTALLLSLVSFNSMAAGTGNVGSVGELKSSVADVGDSDLLNLTCYEMDSKAKDNRILEVKDGKITFLNFLNGALTFDSSYYTDKCSGPSLCGEVKKDGFIVGSFVYSDERKAIAVSKGNSLSGPKTAVFEKVHCSF